MNRQISKFIDDGDKTLELPEFLSLVGIIKMQEECFRQFDKDGNGVLSKDELKELVSKCIQYLIIFVISTDCILFGV